LQKKYGLAEKIALKLLTLHEMTAQTLNKEMIEKPSLWRLTLLLDDDSLVVVANSTVEDASLLHVRLPYDAAAASPLRALEDVVYSNPLLLSDFAKVECVVRSRRFLVMPANEVDAPTREAVASKLWGDDDVTVVTDRIDTVGIDIVAAIDSKIINFLTRTFNNPRIVHHLTPLALYFSRKSRLGNSGKMYVNIRRGALDAIVFGADGLKLLNSYDYHEREDAIYYIMVAAQTAGFNFDDDEMLICGDVALREAIMPELRRYINYVMPVIFPSAMFRAGREAMNAPFELIVLPLCE
jgi:hypothetical protein